MEQLFSDIAKDFSGKSFTKDDLMKKYSKGEWIIFYDKVLSQHNKDIENYIRVFKNKSQHQTL
tara:strand:- start:180 stop:368 length:189 start_codon:yes stop_codon:yes gene_type:complete